MKNWEKNKLDNICQIKKGEQLNKLELEKSGDYPCINGGIEPSGYTDKWNRRENTITISEGGNSCGFVNLLKTKFWSGGHCYSVLNIIADLEKNFLYYALKGRESLIMDLRVGSGLPNIQQSSIKNFTISYPTLITEQKRIAEILSTADAAIEQTQALIAKYNRIKRGLMQDLLTCGIDENGNIRNRQTHKFTVKKGIEVPDDWEVVRLDTFANLITSGSRGWAKFYSVEGDKFIRIGNLTRENIDLRLENLAFVEAPQGSEGNRTALQIDDLLISITADLGIVGIIPVNFGRAYINQHIALVRFDKEQVFPRWIAYFLASEKGQFQFQTLNESGAKAGLNLPTVAALMVAMPKIEEQKQIVKNLDATMETISKEKLNLAKLQAIKKGLMQDLLSGRRKVKSKK